MTQTQTRNFLKQYYKISDEILNLADEIESELKNKFEEIDSVAEFNQYKVLNAMRECRLSEAHFAGTTGYGYNDVGRDVIEKIYARVFETEDALVRVQMVSGTHALSTALFGVLRAGDGLLAPAGAPYDTLKKVIGVDSARGSLIERGVFYKQIDLLDNGDFDFDGIKKALCRQKIKLASIQRSKGYENRRSFSVAEIKKLISFIKYINPQVICMVDNCYGEFVETSEPPADLCVGSLIKNPGGGLAPCGGYIAGRADLVEASAIQLTAPGLGKEIGPSLNANPQILHGLFLAPQVAAAALKGAAFAAKICARAGFSPDPGGELADIVTRVELKTPERVIAFCEGIQSASPVDSFAAPVPADMPGYDSKIIMAAGAFISGSSIELSADAPMREPYAVYLQGGLNYHHAKLGILNALSAIRALEQA